LFCNLCLRRPWWLLATGTRKPSYATDDAGLKYSSEDHLSWLGFVVVFLIDERFLLHPLQLFSNKISFLLMSWVSAGENGLLVPDTAHRKYVTCYPNPEWLITPIVLCAVVSKPSVQYVINHVCSAGCESQEVSQVTRNTGNAYACLHVIITLWFIGTTSYLLSR
jgi:hypothetical protein